MRRFKCIKDVKYVKYDSDDIIGFIEGNIYYTNQSNDGIINEEGHSVVCLSEDKSNFLREFFVELFNNEYNIQTLPIAQKMTSDNFEVEVWHTDDAFSVYMGKNLIIDNIEKEEIIELIAVLQKAVEINDKNTIK